MPEPSPEPSLTTVTPGPDSGKPDAGSKNPGYKARPGEPSWVANASPVVVAAGRAMVGNIPGAKWSATGESSPWVTRVTGIFNTLAGGPPGPPTTPTPTPTPTPDPGDAAPEMPDVTIPGPTPGLNAPPVKTLPPPSSPETPTPTPSPTSSGRMGFGVNPSGRVASFRAGSGVFKPKMNIRSM